MAAAIPLEASPENIRKAVTAVMNLSIAMHKIISNFHLAGERLSWRIGIATGPIVSGVIGMAKFSWDIWGETVNLAARMVCSHMAWEGLPVLDVWTGCTCGVPWRLIWDGNRIRDLTNSSSSLLGGTLARQARAGHLFGPVPHQWPFRGCTKGAHLAQCSYLGVWLY